MTKENKEQASLSKCIWVKDRKLYAIHYQDAKEKIQNAQKRLKERFRYSSLWKGDSIGEEIDKVFLEEFGEKLTRKFLSTNLSEKGSEIVEKATDNTTDKNTDEFDLSEKSEEWFCAKAEYDVKEFIKKLKELNSYGHLKNHTIDKLAGPKLT